MVGKMFPLRGPQDQTPVQTTLTPPPPPTPVANGSRQLNNDQSSSGKDLAPPQNLPGGAIQPKGSVSTNTYPSNSGGLRHRRPKRLYPDDSSTPASPDNGSAKKPQQVMSTQNPTLPAHGILMGEEVPLAVSKRKVLTLGQRDWERVKDSALGALADTGMFFSAFGVAYGIGKRWMSDPLKAQGEILSAMRETVGRALGSLVNSQIGQTLSTAIVEEIQSKLYSAVQTGLSSIQTETINALKDQLQAALQNNSAPVLNEETIRRLLEPIATNLNSTIQDVVLPAVMLDGQLSKNLATSITNMVGDSVKTSLSDLSSSLISSIDGLVKDGTRTAIAVTMFTNDDFLKFTVLSAVVGVLGWKMAAAATAWRTMEADSIRVLESQHLKRMEETAPRVAELRQEIQTRVKDIDDYLLARWFDKKRVDRNPAINIEFDEQEIIDLLKTRDKLLVHPPVRKKVVELWKTREGQIQYIRNVANDIITFPPEVRHRLMAIFVQIAARSVYPGPSGPLNIDMRGIPGVGKDVLLKLIEKHTGLASEDLIMEPVRMGEGGAGEIPSKNWEFIGQKQFKTSDRQKMGQLGEARLKLGKNIEGWERGMLNQINNIPEATWKDPEFQKIWKLVLENETNWWYMKSLGIHLWIGEAIFFFSSNEDDYAPPPKLPGQFSDGANKSRMDISIDLDRTLPDTREKIATKHHAKTTELFTTKPALEGEDVAAALDDDERKELEIRYQSVEKYMLQKHTDATQTGRMQFASMLTAYIAGGLITERALSSKHAGKQPELKDAEETQESLVIEDARLTPTELFLHMQKKDPRLNTASFETNIKRFNKYGVTRDVLADLVQFVDDHYDPLIEKNREKQRLESEREVEKQALFKKGIGFNWKKIPVPGLKNRGMPEEEDFSEWALDSESPPKADTNDALDHTGQSGQQDEDAMSTFIKSLKEHPPGVRKLMLDKLNREMQSDLPDTLTGKLPESGVTKTDRDLAIRASLTSDTTSTASNRTTFKRGTKLQPLSFESKSSEQPKPPPITSLTSSRSRARVQELPTSAEDAASEIEEA